MSDLRDFDAAFAATDDNPIIFRLFGREWSVSRSPRVEAVLFAERLRIEREDANQPITRAETIDLANAYLGADIVAEWRELGITIDRLYEIVNYVVRVQNGLEEGDAPGEAEPAATPGPDGGRSSKDGRSSKRTSSASTASTSRKKSRPA